VVQIRIKKLEMPTLMNIVKNKIGIYNNVYKNNKYAFYDYTNTDFINDALNFSYIRDLPTVQMEYQNFDKEIIDKTFNLHKEKVKKLNGFVTMTDTFARHIKNIYDINIPYVKFRNYPIWKDTQENKRNEFVYVANVPNRFEKYIKFLDELKEKINMKTIFVKYSRSFYLRKTFEYEENMKLLDYRISTDDYDYSSKYGLLLNVDNYNQAEEGLPRKLLLYLMCGIQPIIHSSFVESINYCKNTGINPLIYDKIDDIVDNIKTHKFSNINRKYYSFEERYVDLIHELNLLSELTT